MKDIYLVQRGTFKDRIDISSITGIDSILKFDYMGSSEFEWGSLPASLRRIVKNYKEAVFLENIKIQGKCFSVLRPFNATIDLTIIYDFMIKKAKDEFCINTKEPVYFNKYFEGKEKTVIKKGCVKKTEKTLNYGYCDFWWDIENDWVMLPLDKKKVFTVALDKLVERWENNESV